MNFIGRIGLCKKEINSEKQMKSGDNFGKKKTQNVGGNHGKNLFDKFGSKENRFESSLKV